MSKEKRFYHGGIPGLNKGDILLPPCITGKSTLLEYSKKIDQNSVQRSDRVYITTDKQAADMYAMVYPHGDTYKVSPIGELEDDPDCLEDGLSYQCEKARIVAVLRRGQA
ncbi:MAG: hypothetical protein ACM3UW_02710 [Bacillota bacterium]